MTVEDPALTHMDDMHMPKRMLMILTAHARMGQSSRQTGVWLEELTTPYYAFLDAGMEVDLATIPGGEIPVDPHSLDEAGGRPASVERFLSDPAAMAKLRSALPLSGIAEDTYSAVFLPGGHGTMWDLPASEALAELLGRAWAAGKVVAAVCHGPAGLVNVKDAQGNALVHGRKVAAFSNTEEDAAGLSEAVPFLLETRLRELGADYVRAGDFQPFAVRDGLLVTGQNPASSGDVAALVLAALAESR